MPKFETGGYRPEEAGRKESGLVGLSKIVEEYEKRKGIGPESMKAAEAINPIEESKKILEQEFEPREWTLEEAADMTFAEGKRKSLEKLARAAEARKREKDSKRTAWVESFALGYTQGSIDTGCIDYDDFSEMLGSFRVEDPKDKKWMADFQAKLEKKSKKTPMAKSREIILDMFKIQDEFHAGEVKLEELRAHQGITDGYLQAVIDKGTFASEKEIMGLLQRLRQEHEATKPSYIRD